MNDQEAMDILKSEFSSGPETFIAYLRNDLVWDRKRFLIFIEALEKVCITFLEQDALPKWLAEGYWFYPSFIEEWIGKPMWISRINTNDIYYKSALRYLHELATTFFEGVVVSQMPNIIKEIA